MGVLWCGMLILACIQKQRELHGRVSAPMLLVGAFQMLYVWHATFHERDLLTIHEIRASRYAMFLWESAVMPYFLSLPVRSVLRYGDPYLARPLVVAAALLFVSGFSLFAMASSQKAQFFRLPMHASVAHLKFIKTERGPKLIVSGLWGWARRITTTGEILMATSLAILCGLERRSTLVAYAVTVLYLIYTAVALDKACQRRYRRDWDAYRVVTPSLLIPGVF
eukprot:Polyplicarium_translucidae@DN3031_c0_g2_i1.p1